MQRQIVESTGAAPLKRSVTMVASSGTSTAACRAFYYRRPAWQLACQLRHHAFHLRFRTGEVCDDQAQFGGCDLSSQAQDCR